MSIKYEPLLVKYHNARSGKYFEKLYVDKVL